MREIIVAQQRQINGAVAAAAEQAAADVPGHWLPFVPVAALQPFAANGVYFYAGLPRASVTPLRYRLWAMVATTNSGVNYWSVQLIDSGGNLIAELDTSGQGPDVWAAGDETTFSISPLTTVTEQIVQVKLAKVGTPGDLSLVPMLYVV